MGSVPMDLPDLTSPALGNLDLCKREEREAKGQCPSCGQQLYKFKASGDVCCLERLFSSVEEDTDGQMNRIPLSIPQKVDRGQCLTCVHKMPSSSSSDTCSVGSRSTSLSDEDLNTSRLEMDRGQSSNDQKRQIESDLSGGFNLPDDVMAQPAPAINFAPGLPGTAVYTGPYNEKGEKEGSGEMVWSNGDTFVGQFKNDRREGHGVLTFSPRDPSHPDGGEYVGDWKGNQMHGSGTRRYPNGDVYMGEYVNGKRHGEGRFYYANGDLYWGDWKDNHMHGTGRYYYLSGQRFEGTFAGSKRTGKGKLQRIDGALEVFQYINDQRVGQGVRWSGDRAKAWRLWMPSSGRIGQSNVGLALEKQSISITEAVSLDYEIEQAAASYEKDMNSSMT